MTATGHAASLESVRAAAARIAPFARRTPVLTSTTLDRMAGRRLLFKAEVFQKGGAFKFRGAMSAVALLPADVAARGVATHSSGNHAQALAIAAAIRGIPAFIVMPSNAPAVKRRAVEEYGGRVIECEPTLESRESTAARVVAETGATLIPPFDHPDVIAGQGTIALEILEAHPEVEAIIAPVGGGGMISGIAIAAKAIKSSIKVLAAEPALADDAFRSKKSGSIAPVLRTDTIADGLRTSLGRLTFPVVRDLVDEVLLVEEPAIVAAMRLVWERMKVVIEPSAAVGVAAVLDPSFVARRAFGSTAVVLCGGNVDLERLPFG
ncbi:MAG: pyridoxal-phosphate dependent enzyme [Phycisphaerae bacterium]|nr:pyridoxal-phosphate dependent enzyme [Phycisphaerae bacterium]